MVKKRGHNSFLYSFRKTNKPAKTLSLGRKHESWGRKKKNIVGLRHYGQNFYEIWLAQSGAMVFILNLDKLSLKKLFPTMNI